MPDIAPKTKISDSFAVFSLYEEEFFHKLKNVLQGDNKKLINFYYNFLLFPKKFADSLGFFLQLDFFNKKYCQNSDEMKQIILNLCLFITAFNMKIDEKYPRLRVPNILQNFFKDQIFFDDYNNLYIRFLIFYGLVGMQGIFNCNGTRYDYIYIPGYDEAYPEISAVYHIIQENLLGNLSEIKYYFPEDQSIKALDKEKILTIAENLKTDYQNKIQELNKHTKQCLCGIAINNKRLAEYDASLKKTDQFLLNNSTVEIVENIQGIYASPPSSAESVLSR